MLVIFVAIYRTCHSDIFVAGCLAGLSTLSVSILYQILNDVDAWPWCPPCQFSFAELFVSIAGIVWDSMGLWTVQKYGDPSRWIERDSPTVAESVQTDTSKAVGLEMEAWEGLDDTEGSQGD